MKISEVPHPFIENSINIGIKMSKARENGLTTYVDEYSQGHDNDLIKLYFAGRTLCLDVENSVGERGMLTANWNTESVNYTGCDGEKTLSKLLPISTLRKLRELMDLNKIKYEPKPILN